MLGATMDDVADQPTPVTTLGIDASDQTTSNILQAQRPLPPDIGKMPPAWSIVDQIRPMETALVRGLEQATPNLESAPLRKSFDAAQHLVEPVATPLLKKSVVAPPVTSDTVAAPAEPSIVQQGQDVESPPQKVYSPAPTYPASALREGLTGRVVLRVHLDADGKVVLARVRRSSGHTVLDEAALASVRRWRFQPARRLGVAVEQVIAVPITFRIERRP